MKFQLEIRTLLSAAGDHTHTDRQTHTHTDAHPVTELTRLINLPPP